MQIMSTADGIKIIVEVLKRILECWWLHHGASATDVRLRQVVATVTGGQGSCVRGQGQVQTAVAGGQGSCVGGRGKVQVTVPRGQGSCVRDQGQVQAPVPGGQDQTQRQQDEEHQAVGDMTTLLRTNRVQLIEALGYLDSVLDHLFSRSVITNEEMYNIKSHRVRFGQARELLDILATKGEGACAEFKSVLVKVNPHAATFLET
ncbi:Hypp7663 [Branchiostoma lanceolatum]|uniref:Hypp7663 protein n=1 Tax=Branchiostoma lanceolatum TaxID=7740 RepID=A0A8K0EF33_BRALA|nr:Hypp7663 [Branchiostoma lanceolatum]